MYLVKNTSSFFRTLKSSQVLNLLFLLLRFQTSQSFIHGGMISSLEKWNTIPMKPRGGAASKRIVPPALDRKTIAFSDDKRNSNGLLLRPPNLNALLVNFRRKVVVTDLNMVSSGLTFDDGEQLLISVQKPLGIVLEEISDDKEEEDKPNVVRCIVVDIDENGNAYRSGVRVGYWCIAIQNVDVKHSSLEEVLYRIGNAPKVVNIRFSIGTMQ